MTATRRDVALQFAAYVGTAATRTLTNRLAGAAHLGARNLTLHMASPGGRGDLAVAIFNTIRGLPFESVTTYNAAEVSSGSVLIFLAGDERLVDPTARFLLHAPRLVLPVDGPTFEFTEIDLANYAKRLAGIRRQTSEIIARRTGMTVADADALQSEEWTEVDAEEAVRLGIATGIGIPELRPETPLTAIDFRRTAGDPLE